MDRKLFDYINKSAYFIWERTKCQNALDVWYCAEDIACYLEQKNITTLNKLKEITNLSDESYEYVDFLRNIAFRIYIYTKNQDSFKNWLDAESLIKNYEWLNAIVCMADYYNNEKQNQEFIKNIRSWKVKRYYYPFSQN